MAIDVASVTHDAASLYLFVDSVSTLAEQASSAVYVKASEDFFSYISEVGETTKSYLCDFPIHLPKNDFLRQIYRQKLTVLRSCWNELHRFVKAVRDADTLNTPFSLLLTYYEKFHKIPAFQNVNFAVFHLHEVNYLQIQASWITRLAGQLQSVIPACPSFPTDLGLIGIPYSQSSSVFLNALIPHEMGHFVFERLNKSTNLQPDIVSALNSETRSSSL